MSETEPKVGSGSEDPEPEVLGLEFVAVDEQAGNTHNYN